MSTQKSHSPPRWQAVKKRVKKALLWLTKACVAVFFCPRERTVTVPRDAAMQTEEEPVQGSAAEDTCHEEKVQNNNAVEENEGVVCSNIQDNNQIFRTHSSLVIPNVDQPERYQPEDETLLTATTPAEQLRHLATSHQHAQDQYDSFQAQIYPSSEGYPDPLSHFRAYLASKGIQRPELSPLKSTFVLPPSNLCAGLMPTYTYIDHGNLYIYPPVFQLMSMHKRAGGVPPPQLCNMAAFHAAPPPC